MPSETSRIEAFSDGVFSIAATLLVLELKPPAPSLSFWQGMLAQWPGFASFLLSFLFIGIMWINHHRLFAHIRRTDDSLLGVNLILLLGVVWIPYPTSLMAQAVGTGKIREAAILYNGSYLAIALLFNLLMFTCLHKGLVDSNSNAVRKIQRNFALGPMIYVPCFLLSWWSVPVSLGLNGALALYFLLSPDKAGHGQAAHIS